MRASATITGIFAAFMLAGQAMAQDSLAPTEADECVKTQVNPSFYSNLAETIKLQVRMGTRTAEDATQIVEGWQERMKNSIAFCEDNYGVKTTAYSQGYIKAVTDNINNIMERKVP